MFNVLPDTTKSNIKKEYTLRWYTMLILFVLFVQVFFLISLFPSLIFSIYREKELTTQIGLLQNSASSKNIDSIGGTINTINQTLNSIHAVQYPTVVPIIQSILSAQAGQVKLDEFDYTATGTSTATVTIIGLSATRESLVSFVSSLNASGVFTDVTSPVSNLEKDTNINFTINLTIAQ